MDSWSQCVQDQLSQGFN